MIEEITNAISTIYNLLYLLGGGLVGVISYFGMRKLNKIKEVSETKKYTKLNNVAGDAAILEQQECLLLVIAESSEKVYKLKVESYNQKEENHLYKLALKRLIVSCGQICEEPEMCKKHILDVLEDLKITLDEQ